jgi:O-antigen/teichoic acid export membrane protein
MDFVRQRVLLAVDPCVAFVVTIALAAGGMGYWCLIVGAIAGAWTGALVALRACPYPLRVRLDRRTAREYFSFSWPLFVAGIGAIVIAQGSVLGGSYGLAVSISSFTDGADSIITQTLYPAICAVRHRVDLLHESFVKSNRLALMWGMPFGLGLTLFAPDLVHFVLGEQWHPAIIVMQAFGLITAISQIGFNWTAFMRAVNYTKPMAIVAGVTAGSFVAITIPLMLIDGLTGYAIGMLANVLASLAARTYFLTKLFSGFQMLWHAARAIAPSVPAVLVVLLMHTLDQGQRSLMLAAGEVAVYVVTTIIATLILERALLREIAGYLRPAPAAAGG